jgi:hypothetical protein
MNPLAKLEADSVADAQRFFDQAYTAVASAKNITIIGGGSVGVELATEIRAGEVGLSLVTPGTTIRTESHGLTYTFLCFLHSVFAAFPDQRTIRILHSGDRLLPGDPVSDKFRIQVLP